MDLILFAANLTEVSFKKQKKKKTVVVLLSFVESQLLTSCKWL